MSTLVVTIPERISEDQAKRLKDQLQREVGVKVLILVGASSAVLIESDLAVAS